jgi:hypothetical protein
MVWGGTTNYRNPLKMFVESGEDVKFSTEMSCNKFNSEEFYAAVDSRGVMYTWGGNM